MAKAYKCDLCGKYVDSCCGLNGIDIYPNEFRKIGITKDKKHEAKEVCSDCYEKIKSAVIESFKNGKLAISE